MRRSFPLSRTAGLGAADRGLTDAEAEQRRALYGRNSIVEAPPSGWRNVARDTVRDPMIWFLAGTAMLFVWLAE